MFPSKVTAYQKTALAIRATGRPMIFSVCRYGWPAVGEWGVAPTRGVSVWREEFVESISAVRPPMVAKLRSALEVSGVRESVKAFGWPVEFADIDIASCQVPASLPPSSSRASLALARLLPPRRRRPSRCRISRRIGPELCSPPDLPQPNPARSRPPQANRHGARAAAEWSLT